MKSLKDNSIVKWVYAYFDLLLKALPILFLFMFIQLFVLGRVLGSVDAKMFDAFNLFSVKSNQVSHSLIWIITVASFNIIFLIFLYLTLKRLVIFIKNVFDEKPFEEENGKNLKFVGVMVIVLSALSHLAVVVSVQNSIITDLSWETHKLISVTSFLSFAFSPYLFSGLLFIVIGEVILHGARMKQEIDLTV